MGGGARRSQGQRTFNFVTAAHRTATGALRADSRGFMGDEAAWAAEIRAQGECLGFPPLLPSWPTARESMAAANDLSATWEDHGGVADCSSGQVSLCSAAGEGEARASSVTEANIRACCTNGRVTSVTGDTTFL